MPLPTTHAAASLQFTSESHPNGTSLNLSVPTQLEEVVFLELGGTKGKEGRNEEHAWSSWGYADPGQSHRTWGSTCNLSHD